MRRKDSIRYKFGEWYEENAKFHEPSLTYTFESGYMAREEEVQKLKDAIKLIVSESEFAYYADAPGLHDAINEAEKLI